MFTFNIILTAIFNAVETALKNTKHSHDWVSLPLGVDFLILVLLLVTIATFSGLQVRLDIVKVLETDKVTESLGGRHGVVPYAPREHA